MKQNSSNCYVGCFEIGRTSALHKIVGIIRKENYVDKCNYISRYQPGSYCLVTNRSSKWKMTISILPKMCLNDL